MSFTRIVAASSLTLFACASQQGAEPAQPAADATMATTALTCALQALGDSNVGGTLTFKAAEGGVLIEGEVTGLAPNKKHGFHIHEKGDCSAPDGTSAGGHFNPGSHDHGDIDATPSHVGDLGNLEADANGVAHVSKLKTGATLTEGDNAVIGRGVIVHADTDDLTTQPTGAAGGRIACGVIAAN